MHLRYKRLNIQKPKKQKKERLIKKPTPLQYSKLSNNSRMPKIRAIVKSKKPKYILKGGITNFQPLEQRYPYIENFIQKEYFLYVETGLWKILKINNN